MIRYAGKAVCDRCGKKYDWICAFPDAEEIVPDMWKRLQKNVSKYSFTDELYLVDIECPKCGGLEELSYKRF